MVSYFLIYYNFIFFFNICNIYLINKCVVICNIKIEYINKLIYEGGLYHNEKMHVKSLL